MMRKRSVVAEESTNKDYCSVVKGMVWDETCDGVASGNKLFEHTSTHFSRAWQKSISKAIVPIHPETLSLAVMPSRSYN